MMTNKEALDMLLNGDYENLYAGMEKMSVELIKSKLQEIPTEFFEPRIKLDKEGTKHISFIQFSAEIANMSAERQKGMMEKYNINPYDMSKLQSIIDSIKVAKEYGNVEAVHEKEKVEADEHIYGFSLASDDKLSKAYPLWLAYLFANSPNPMKEVTAKLKEDGMEDKYDPMMIVGLIEHANGLMEGRTEEEKKDFYVKSINSILEKDIKKMSKEMDWER